MTLRLGGQGVDCLAGSANGLPASANRERAHFALLDAAGAPAKIDPDSQVLDRVLTDRFEKIKRAPGVDIRASEDVRFQCVNAVAVAETKQDVVHCG